MIFASLHNALGLVLKRKRMIFVYYVINLAFGLMIMHPIHGALTDAAGHSLVGQHLAVKMDMDFLLEFIVKNSIAGSPMLLLVMTAGIIYLAANLFLSGGAYGVLATGDVYSARLFWENAGRYFGRFLRLFFWSLPLLGIFLCIQFIETGLVRVIWGSDPYQYITYWGAWVKTGLAYAGLLMYLMVLDYGRIIIVLTDERKTRNALWHALKFTFRKFFAAFGLSSVVFLAGIVALVIYNPVADALSAPSALIVFLLLMFQQFFVFVRMGLRLTLYAGQMELYKVASLATEAGAVSSPSLSAQPI